MEIKQDAFGFSMDLKMSEELIITILLKDVIINEIYFSPRDTYDLFFYLMRNYYAGIYEGTQYGSEYLIHGMYFRIESEMSLKIYHPTTTFNIKKDEAIKLLDIIYKGMFEVLDDVYVGEPQFHVKSERKFRNIETDVFIGIPDEDVNIVDTERIQNAVGEFMVAMGFEYEAKDEPVWGSFFAKLFFKIKDPKTQHEIGEIYEAGKDALKLKYLNIPNANATGTLAHSAAELIASMSPFKKAVIRTGAILIVKTTVDNEPYLIVETISPQLSVQLDENPKLLKNPDELLTFIGKEPKKSMGLLNEGEAVPQIAE